MPTPNLALKRERQQRGWSQLELAKRIEAPDYYISRWERGNVAPSPYYQQKLCVLFEKSAEELGFLAPAELELSLQSDETHAVQSPVDVVPTLQESRPSNDTPLLSAEETIAHSPPVVPHGMLRRDPPRWFPVATFLLGVVLTLGGVFAFQGFQGWRSSSSQPIPKFTTPNGGRVNQEWFGPNWHYLGWSSGEAYKGHIHTFYASNKCLEVPLGNFLNNPDGVQVQLWDCKQAIASNGYDMNQIWQQVNNHDGTWSFYVQDGNTTYCLDSLMGHHYNGSPVEVWPCNKGNPQKWTIGPEGQLLSVDSPGYCLDDNNRGSDNAAQIDLWSCAY